MPGNPSGFTQWDIIDGIDELAAWLLDMSAAPDPENQHQFEACLNTIRQQVARLDSIVDKQKDVPERDKPRNTMTMMALRYSSKVVDPC